MVLDDGKAINTQAPIHIENTKQYKLSPDTAQLTALGRCLFDG